MYKFATAIGVDIGRSTIRTAIVRYDGKIIENITFPIEGVATRDELVSRVITAVKETRARSVKHGVNPLCTGVAARGFIDHLEGIVKGPGHNIVDWHDVPLAGILYHETGLPTFIDNDANLMAYAEYGFGSASGFSDVLYVALRSGIGGAVIIGGKLYRGVSNAAGEIGQMSIDYRGAMSDTGIRGSLEELGSSEALVNSYIKRVGDSGKPGVTSARTLFSMATGGDTDAMDAVMENAAIIGVGLGNLVSIFAPEIIVLGGGMAMADSFYIDAIRSSAWEYSLDAGAGRVRIERATLGHNSSIMGASLYALTRLDGRCI